MRILVFVGYYLPGYKAGGPIRTLANMVDHLSDDYQFKIITADRDFDDISSYSGIDIDGWNTVGQAEEFYASPSGRSLSKLKKLFHSTDYDVIYLNSFFSWHFTIKPLLLRLLGLIPTKPLVLAPCGEFSSGALSNIFHRPTTNSLWCHKSSPFMVILPLCYPP